MLPVVVSGVPRVLACGRARMDLLVNTHTHTHSWARSSQVNSKQCLSVCGLLAHRSCVLRIPLAAAGRRGT